MRINEAVKRNPARFPEDFCFLLTEAETAHLKSQNAISSMANRALQRGFTHAGAYALSAVLKTPVAVAALEARALKEAQLLLFKIQTEAMMRKPSRMLAQSGTEQGLTFGQIHAMTSASAPKLARTLRELKMLGLIERLPDGTPDEHQIQLFPDLNDAGH